MVFDELWARRQTIDIGRGVVAQVPTIDDLILTKRFANRPKDIEDIRLLTILRDERPRAYLAQPITAEEREGVQDLVRWFRGRYRSPAERLEYARRAYRRWTHAAVASHSPTDTAADG